MSILARRPQTGRRLSSELEELIRSAIQRGELKPGQRLGSAKQLAKHWQASYGAVRQSLETLAAKGLVERRPRAGTFVSSSAEPAPVKSGARDIIGLLVPDIRMPDYSLVTRHLQDAAHQAGFEMLVSSTDNERERYDQSVLRHLKAGVGGLILVAPQKARISLETLLELEKSGIPVVNYARTVDVVRWPTVQTDTFQAVYLPVRHLCQLGRKRIGFLSYPTPDLHGMQMHYGLYRAIAESGLTADNVVEFTLPDDIYLNGWLDGHAMGMILGKWLNENPKVDAICCTHFHIAAAMLTVLGQRGVRVPDDIAVTGSGRMAEYFGLAPDAVTTVDTRMDRAAAEMIHALQRGRDPQVEDQATVIAIQPDLVIGRSTVFNGETAAPT